MNWLESRTFKVLSFVVLFFFCWTFGGLFDIAYAVKESSQKSESRIQKTKKQKPEEKFSKTIEDIDEIVEEVAKAGNLDDKKIKKKKLKAKKQEIEELDVEIKKQFAETERKLKDANLPPEILQRHYDFVKQYEDNLNELKTNLDDIERVNTEIEIDAEIEKAKKHLKKVKPPKKHKPLDPNKLPHRTPDVIKKEPRLNKEQFLEDRGLVSVVPVNPNGLGHEAGSSQEKTRGQKPILVASNGSLSGILDSPTSNPQTLSPALYAQADTSTPSTPSTGSGQGSSGQGSSVQAPPTSADLAETIEVQFTPEITAKALELENNPVKIYNWVRNNIEFVPTYGSIQGADYCLQTKLCNAFDTASLLIALLRVSGIHARYVEGTVEIPIEKVMNWVGGFTDSNSALTLIASGGIPGTILTSGGEIVAAQMEHVWVEAWVDMIPSFGAIHKQGDTWIPMDASFKQYTYSNRADLETDVPFDSEAFMDQLESTATINETEGYVSNINSNFIQTTMTDYQTLLQNYIDQNMPDATAGDIFGKREIIQHNFQILVETLPYAVLIDGWRGSQIIDNLRHKLTFEIATNLLYTATLPELLGKRITLSYSPASENDRTIIDLYGGIYNTPAYLINVKPQLKIEGNIVAEGYAIVLGTEHSFNMRFSIPDKVPDIVSNNIIAGGFYAIGLIGGKLSPSYGKIIEQRAEMLRSYLENGGDSSSDHGFGEQMYLSVLAYFYELNAFTNYSAKLMEIDYLKRPSEGIFGLSLSIESIFGVPTLVRTTGVYIDIDRNIYSPVSLKGDFSSAKNFMIISGNISSNLENGIIEQMYEWESISASKAIYVANNMGLKIYHVDQFNYQSVLPLLQVSNQVKTDIMNSVNAGKEVTIPEQNIQLNNWNGVGYIVTDPSTGAAAYLISGGLSGGSSTEEKNYREIIEKSLAIAFTLIAIVALVDAFEILAAALVAAVLIPWGWILIPFILLSIVTIAIIIYLLVTEVLIPNVRDIRELIEGT